MRQPWRRSRTGSRIAATSNTPPNALGGGRFAAQDFLRAIDSLAARFTTIRGDLGRAGDWAQRATTTDANSQLGWYVLGVSRLEGPHADRAAAREALRHCASLPGNYAAECRGAM